jgi:hypothetical protein
MAEITKFERLGTTAKPVNSDPDVDANHEWVWIVLGIIFTFAVVVAGIVVGLLTGAFG